MGFSHSIAIFVVVTAYIVGGASAGRFKSRPTVLQANIAFKTSSYSFESKIPRKLSTPVECARTCKVGEPPKTCLYTFTVEFYATLTNACKSCVSNATTRLTESCQCITVDGYETSGIITANRMYPGPSIVVCENDYVVVDVINHVAGNGITIHWHGIEQRDYQYYDGVPFVTQCPIQEGTTFRYQWLARNPGTHFWHAHTGLHKAVGLEGALIIREPKFTEPNNRLWDTEDLNHIIFITDWLHDAAEEHFPGTILRRPDQEPDNILINGRGRWTDPATGSTTTSPRSIFTVKPGHRYRFRMINSCSFTCPVTMTIEGHKLIVFSTDGEPVVPVKVTSITSFSAERFDFILNADKSAGDYWIQVRAIGPCASRRLQQLAILRYESDEPPRKSNSEEPTYDRGLKRGVVLNELNVRCDTPTPIKNVVCITQLESVESVPSLVLRKEPDVKLFMPFGFYFYKERDIFNSGTYKKFLVNEGVETSALLSNVSNVFPTSPLISQRDDNPEDQICSPDNPPARCAHSQPCFCSSVHEIPLNSVVELILVDETQSPGLSHPFHLHGHAFHIFGEGSGKDFNISNINIDHVKDLDKKGKLRRFMEKPPAKDTLALPNNGFTIIRFLANNPGYWLFHCHFVPHLVEGMSTVFHVGGPEDLPPIPKDFPKCGNFIPRIES